MQGHSPLIELPPLSPGIQARVMEEVDVVETVRRGWSGGTAEETPRVNTSIIPLCKRYGSVIVSLLCVPFLLPCTKRLTMMVSKPSVLVAVQV